MFGTKVKEVLTDQTPWSSTVVNINRMRRKRRARVILIGLLVGIPLIACMLFGAVSSVVTARNQAQAATLPAADLGEIPPGPPQITERVIPVPAQVWIPLDSPTCQGCLIRFK